ncbi:MAG: MFS transporter, partial [Pseudomonadota bacterium]
MADRIAPQSALVTPILVAGSATLLIGFAIRAAFGVFQIPVAEEFGWPRAEFSTAIAIQNLAWGIGQPIFGAIAEKIGDRKAIFLGALLYALGLGLTAIATTPVQYQLLEVAVGFGIAGTGFGVILAIVGRSASDENRSMALAIATAVGSAGQVIGPPAVEVLLSHMPFQSVFLILAASALTPLLFLPLLRTPSLNFDSNESPSLTDAVSRAFRDPSYTLIFVGFFSCGYQLGFMTAHFPAFVTEMCGPIAPGGLLDGIGISTTSALGAAAFGLIGLANIAGTLLAGWAGKYWPKRYLLAGIYTGRTLFAALFILFPITPASVLLFSAGMGALWLATVPLTSGLVGQIY